MLMLEQMLIFNLGYLSSDVRYLDHHTFCISAAKESPCGKTAGVFSVQLNEATLVFGITFSRLLIASTNTDLASSIKAFWTYKISRACKALDNALNLGHYRFYIKSGGYYSQKYGHSVSF